MVVSTWEGELWLYDLERNTKIKFPLGKLSMRNFPSGHRTKEEVFAFVASSPESPLGWNLYVQPADGTGVAQPQTKGQVERHLDCWTPDGKSLIYMELGNEDPSIWIVDIGIGSTPRMIVNNSRASAVSPDGKWLAFSSAETGKHEVYVQASFRHQFQISYFFRWWKQSEMVCRWQGALLPQWRSIPASSNNHGAFAECDNS